MSKPKQRGRPQRTGLYITLAILLLVVGVGLTWRFAAPDSWSRVFAGGGEKQDDHAGQVAVLISPVPISAFTALDPTAFINPTTGSFYVSWVTEETADKMGLVRDPATIRGRVLKRDKSAGLAFSEADFAPKGTQAGMTSAIEPGHRGVSLNINEIEGLRGLKRFVRFDLFAVKTKSNAPSNGAAGYMTPEARMAAEAGSEWSTDRLVIAQNAMILEPAMQGVSGKRGEEVYISIRDDEAITLSDARAKGAKIICLARSGLPGGDTSVFERPEEPIAVDSIQIYTGDKSSTTYVPANRPEDAAAKEAPAPK
ncbi:MAG: hypothetical protein JNL28_07665 [Planctomycetes bacterium]|nr:hypothetical protein [Planctomycetota bacterium]